MPQPLPIEVLSLGFDEEMDVEEPVELDERVLITEVSAQMNEEIGIVESKKPLVFRRNPPPTKLTIFLEENSVMSFDRQTFEIARSEPE